MHIFRKTQIIYILFKKIQYFFIGLDMFAQQKKQGADLAENTGALFPFNQKLCSFIIFLLRLPIPVLGREPKK